MGDFVFGGRRPSGPANTDEIDGFVKTLVRERYCEQCREFGKCLEMSVQHIDAEGHRLYFYRAICKPCIKEMFNDSDC